MRPLAEEDKHLLAKWLSNPRVLEFYKGRNHSFDNEVFYAFEEVKRMAELKGKEIGYIRFYPPPGTTIALRCYETCSFKTIRVFPKHELHEGGISRRLVNGIEKLKASVEEKRITNSFHPRQRWQFPAARCLDKFLPLKILLGIDNNHLSIRLTLL
ncbi:hypothetical protein P4T04_01865 [Bacillus badius]|uniref:hypothetical protein n=1 Tax=Bacillus badius TaxID=1455 RepID=UPI002E24FDBE|nr:hypothetical protein [Bacillus badius]